MDRGWAFPVFLLCSCFGFFAPAQAAEFCDPTPDATALLNSYSGLASHCEPAPGRTGGILTFYGVPMTEGATPADAVHSWIIAYAGAIGMSPQDLVDPHNPIRQTVVDSGRFTAFMHQQYFYGFPVAGNTVRFLVLNGTPARVIYVSAQIRDVVGGSTISGEIVLDGSEALAVVRDSPTYGYLSEWSSPILVVLAAGAGDSGEPIYAWRFRGRNLDGPDVEAMTFFVDASDGEVVRVRSDVVDSDDVIFGRVQGLVTPGTLPDAPYNPPEVANLPGVRVEIVESGWSTETDSAGIFGIMHTGAWPVTLEATLTGESVEVVAEQGCAVVEQATGIEPPDLIVELFANDGPVNGCPDEPNEFSTSQLNALLHVSQARDFFLDREPDFVELTSAGGAALPLKMHVNHDNPNDPCNARFAPPDAFFFRPADGVCVNMAYSSIVTHEFGHLVVDTLQLGQWAFGEGFSDTLAILVHDDAVVGRDYKGPGQHMRDIAGSYALYPCQSLESHYCGKILARVWWNFREDADGPGADWAASLEIARRLFASWSLITGGVPASSLESATPQTAIEMLVIDDDDGVLGNGTPHVCALCAALFNRSIPCPPVILDDDGDGVPNVCENDCNGNGIPDSEDLASGTSLDCNGNDRPDECDVPPIGGGPDCNGDVVPDECQLAGNDCNGNGVPDECDVAPIGIGPDCNGDGVPDECQLGGNDCNANSVPDECEVDCNANGVPDECDVPPIGAGPDCNEDGVPDECQLAGNDCNGNGVPDECEVDCNGNGVPDECDVPPIGAGPDCNGDVIPDECQLAGNDCNGNGVPDECEDDCNDNGLPDACDVPPIGPGPDCNGNGQPDECEVPPIGFGPDCNGNGVPDECETDCNGNGVPDECDLPPIGAGPDCNGNSIPDECDVPPIGAGPDCHADGVPDECQLAGNDCNENDVPDECDVPPLGAGPDCNDNGFPDECDVPPIGFGPDCNANGLPDECEVPPMGVGPDCNEDGVPDECQLAGNDCNGNSVPDECEVDCNTNGVPDECDVPPIGFGPDCNGNGVPDECEDDCNDNGLPDACDVPPIGAGPDCNGNGHPDECEVPPIGNGPDCNGDGVPDDCQLTGNDCNDNGVPDECEADCNDNGLADACDISAGTSSDVNLNGIPDECECADLGCYDGDVCTWDRFESGACVHDPNVYGDVDHSGSVNLIDVMAVLNDVGTTQECTIRDFDITPCAGDGVINVFDVFAAMDAAVGIDACCGGP